MRARHVSSGPEKRLAISGLLAVHWVVVALVLMVTAASARTGGEGGPRREVRPKANGSSLEDLLRAAKRYRADLGELLTLLEREAESATRTAEARRTLFAEGALTSGEIESAEQVLAAAREKVDEVREEIEKAEAMMAEAEAMEGLPQAPPLRESHRVTTTVTCSMGTGGWSLGKIAEVKIFFAAHFGRSLPVSAFGQTALHDRLGYDHRSAVDVPLHPSSPQGQALIAFLRATRIPFLAFHRAVPGSATGAHIHIGYPSRRL
jgi:hypothetical protein